VPFPVPGDAAFAGLTVSCTRPAHCLGVGSFFDDPHGGGPDFTLAEAWNGSKWRILPSPNPGQSSAFTQVSCVPRSGCMAVGAYTDAKNASHNFAAWWNGKKWRVLAMPGRAGISGLSCARHQLHGGQQPALRVHRGRRHVGPRPRRAVERPHLAAHPHGQPRLQRRAVGQAGLLTLIERWNDTRWRRLTSVNP